VDRGPHRWGARLLVCLDDVVRRLPQPFHADPADRFLVVQARELGIPLLSADNS
jgi:PIN domain nuclease of toxin-antitoxin system